MSSTRTTLAYAVSRSPRTVTFWSGLAATASSMSTRSSSGAMVRPLTMMFPSASTLMMISRSAVEIGPAKAACGSAICISRSVW